MVAASELVITQRMVSIWGGYYGLRHEAELSYHFGGNYPKTLRDALADTFVSRAALVACWSVACAVGSNVRPLLDAAVRCAAPIALEAAGPAIAYYGGSPVAAREAARDLRCLPSIETDESISRCVPVLENAYLAVMSRASGAVVGPLLGCVSTWQSQRKLDAALVVADSIGRVPDTLGSLSLAQIVDQRIRDRLREALIAAVNRCLEHASW